MNKIIKPLPIIFGILILTSLSGFPFADATINSDTISGWRNSQYGTSNQSDHSYWISVAQQMVNKFPGSSPGGVLVVGELDGQPGTTEETLLQFPNPGGNYPHVNFIGTDEIEPMLDAYDQYGLKVYLQPESAHAEIPMLMDLIMDRYKHHPSVIGFGVDAEWYFEADYPGYGKALSTAEVNAWATQVKTYNPNYKLMVKHWDYDQLSNARPSNVLFLTDSEQLGSQNSAVNEYIDWIDHFNGAEVGFQYAYPSDQSWWGNFNDPATQIIQPVLDARPNANIGALFLVDFSVENILSEQNIGSPCAPNCDYDNPPTPSDTQPPVITPLGTSKSIPFGSVYTELGATVTDNDPTYSGTVTIEGSVNTSVPGTYIITYTAPSDAAGNVPVGKSITITVQEDSTPSTGPILFFDDFESGFAKWSESGEGDWKTESPAEVQVPGHSSNLVAHSDNCDSTCTITIKNSIDLSSSSSATLSFWRFVDNAIDNGEYLKVELYDGTKWNTVFNWTHQSGDDNTWHQETVNLDSYLGVSNFNVRFVTHESFYLEDIEIDDVLIHTTGSPTPSDTEPPTITPLGTSKSIPFGSVYTELGATVTDNDPNYSGSVTIGGSVNTSVPGTYIITYTAPADAAGNVPVGKSIAIIVQEEVVTDTQAPVITPLGTSKSIPFGSVYTELGATVTDNDPNYSGSVTIGGSVNTSVPGTYIITYTAPADAAGNVPVGKSIAIIVQEDSSPSTGPILFSDDFESGFAKWTETGEGDWNVESEAETQVAGFPSNLVAHSDNCDSTCTITMSAPIDLSTHASVTLSFLRFVDDSLDAGEYLKVEAYDGTSWNTLFFWTDGDGADDIWHQETVDLKDYLGVSNFNLRFVTNQSFYLEDVEIDNVTIEGQGGEIIPALAIDPIFDPTILVLSTDSAGKNPDETLISSTVEDFGVPEQTVPEQTSNGVSRTQ